MSTILSAWCDMCTHLQALAFMAVVPVLLYAWHTETSPQDVHATDTLPHDTEAQDIGTPDAPIETRWAA